jgi:signal transduction histidine kinase
VRALKEFAHPDNREQERADLNQALLSTLTVARNELDYIAQVSTELGRLPPVSRYVGELNQVFLNLLINAAHALADPKREGKGVIRVRSALENEGVHIEIEDNGCGIPEGIRERIFDPFFATKEVGRGSGPGLSLARAVIVDKHHGTLSVETQDGVGTTFRTWVPLSGRDRKIG